MPILEERLAKLERAEAQRSAEHFAMVDQLDRIYKRFVQRMARADQTAAKPVTPGSDNGESVLSLRNRLGR